LTGPFLRRVEERFNAAPAEWHSDAKASERERVWRAVASGEARIVVGARSALFLPWRNPGLIVVDEEHEPAFKQEDGVAYHARDMAVVMGSLGRFPVVLSSATPSLESLVNVDRGRYAHVRLADRFGRPELPPLDLVDMRRQQVPAGRWLAEPVAQAVADTIAAGSQALLFLNRRGYAPLTLCRACGQRLECRNCSAWLVEHRFRKQLLCHHCGHHEPVPQACPSCQAEGSLTPCGPGVERLAEEAAERFPDARTVILSSDLMSGAGLRGTLSDIAEGRYDLIIGTQLVAKGHHFPHLTLACVVDGDLVLETSDPRAGERTWQLLAQVAGRAGRGEKPGQALVQTYVPDHPLMQAIKAGDRDGFLAREKLTRESAGLPPYGRSPPSSCPAPTRARPNAMPVRLRAGRLRRTPSSFSDLRLHRCIWCAAGIAGVSCSRRRAAAISRPTCAPGSPPNARAAHCASRSTSILTVSCKALQSSTFAEESYTTKHRPSPGTKPWHLMFWPSTRGRPRPGRSSSTRRPSPSRFPSRNSPRAIRSPAGSSTTRKRSGKARSPPPEPPWPRPGSRPKTSPRSASPTSAKPHWCGTGPPASRSIRRSSGRTGARPASART
jgi:primosomal protein N'